MNGYHSWCVFDAPYLNYTYDADGDVTTVKDPMGHLTTYAYDALDRLTTISQTVGGTTTYAYDAAGRQVGLTDPDGNTTTWTYDANDRVTAEANPLRTATYAYDADGEVTATTDADGRQTTYSYNADGDRTGETWVGASTAEVVTYTYDADNEMTAADDTYSTLTFTYDADGEQTSAATSSPGGQPSVTLSSTYDDQGNRVGLADDLSTPAVISYTYDSMGEITGITAVYGSDEPLLVTFTYDNAGRMTAIERSVGSGLFLLIGGGTVEIDTNLSYDAASRVTTIVHDVLGGPVIQTYTYDYNAASELTAETNHEGTLSYTYDNGGVSAKGVIPKSPSKLGYPGKFGEMGRGVTTGAISQHRTHCQSLRGKANRNRRENERFCPEIGRFRPESGQFRLDVISACRNLD